jgi:hypothetical protein
MRDTPRAIARHQSGWDTPPPLPCPKQNCCNSTTAYSALELTVGLSSKEKPTVKSSDRGYPLDAMSRPKARKAGAVM